LNVDSTLVDLKIVKLHYFQIDIDGLIEP